MPRRANQKLKILYILKLFTEKTDEDHTITVNEIIAYLENNGISAERKSVYDDIEALRLFGVDIVKRKSKTHDYFLASRDFEVSEVKLLIDSVQSSKFVTHKKSVDLIKKLEKLVSGEQSKALRRQVYIVDRVKSMNENIFYNIDTIHAAISENKKIAFQYWSWAVLKEQVYKKNGSLICVTPTALTMDRDNYYLICYSARFDDFTHYRVDKMVSVKILEEDCEHPKHDFNPALYMKSLFSMFGGDVVNVSMQFNNSVIGAVLDRFGKDILIREVDEYNFIANLEVFVSPTFLLWVLGFGESAKILSPDWVIDELYNLGYDAIKQYVED